jgi:hypothetical protein
VFKPNDTQEPRSPKSIHLYLAPDSLDLQDNSRSQQSRVHRHTLLESQKLVYVPCRPHELPSKELGFVTGKPNGEITGQADYKDSQYVCTVWRRQDNVLSSHTMAPSGVILAAPSV